MPGFPFPPEDKSHLSLGRGLSRQTGDRRSPGPQKTPCSGGVFGEGNPTQSPAVSPRPPPKIQRACCSTESSSPAPPPKPRTPRGQKACSSAEHHPLRTTRPSSRTLPQPHTHPCRESPRSPPPRPPGVGGGGRQARPAPKTLAWPHTALGPHSGSGKAGTSAPPPADTHATPRHAAAPD